MSHVVCSKIIITDLDILRRAVERLGKLKWNPDKKTFHWYGTWVNDYHKDDAAYKNGIDTEDYGKCDVCLQMEGVQYEIGVMRRNDGQGWSLVWDYVDDGYKLQDVIGKAGEKLMALYAEEYIHDYAIRNGFMMQQGTDDEGNITLTLTQP